MNMRLIATLLLIGCATTLPEPRPTTPAVPAHAESLEGPQDREVKRLVAELDASLANPQPAVPESTPPEPLWTGYMVVETESVPPAVAIVFPEGPEGDVITNQTLADGIPLHTTTASAEGGYWLFPVTRGALLFHAVRVYDDGRVTVEIPLHGEYDDTTIIVAAGVLDDPSGATTYTPCAHGICGRLRKAVANHVAGCEGPHCAEVLKPAQ